MTSSSRALAQSASRISHTASRASPSSICSRRSISQSLPRRLSSDSHPPSTPDSASTTAAATTKTPQDPLHQVFAHPTWSIRSSLLPTTQAQTQAQTQAEEPDPEITPQTLAHHLRLAALPPPASPREEARLLATLRTQLRFVRAVQAVTEAAAVEPLRAIRDETAAGAAEATVGLDALRGALGRETRFGFRGRPRRSRASGAVSGGEARSEAEGRERSDEERLVERATAARRERGYYVVESGKAKGGD